MPGSAAGLGCRGAVRCRVGRRARRRPFGGSGAVSRRASPWGAQMPFESAGEVEERDSAGLWLDVAATDRGHRAHVLTDGLVAAEGSVLPLLGLLSKARREESFPTALLQRGLEVDIGTAEATQSEDKVRILNSIACPGPRPRC